MRRALMALSRPVRSEASRRMFQVRLMGTVEEGLIKDAKSAEEAEKIQTRNAAIREEHHRIRDDYPIHRYTSLPPYSCVCVCACVCVCVCVAAVGCRPVRRSGGYAYGVAEGRVACSGEGRAEVVCWV